jgi:hypothetical protein
MTALGHGLPRQSSADAAGPPQRAAVPTEGREFWVGPKAAFTAVYTWTPKPIAQWVWPLRLTPFQIANGTAPHWRLRRTERLIVNTHRQFPRLKYRRTTIRIEVGAHDHELTLKAPTQTVDLLR